MIRIHALRALMAEQSIDALLIEKRENYFYLTGMTGEESFCVITQSEVFMIVDFRFVTQATEQITARVPDCKVIEYKGDVNTTLNTLFRELGVKNIGFDATNMLCQRFEDLKMKVFNVKFINATGLVEKLRVRKSEDEIQIIQAAVDLADKAFQNLLQYIRPGVSELDVAAELEYQMRKLGSTRPSFETIIASGARAALPHGVASEKLIKFGDVVTIDFGAHYKGYCSDMTRTVFVGKVKPQLKKIYEIVLEAQQAAVQGCFAGRTGRHVDSIARGIITQAGFGDNFGHGTGHGVGVEIHESPRVNMRNENPLEDGMVVTIEPGIYLPGIGGVRIEDVVVIRGQNPLILTKTPKDILIV